MTTPFDPAEAQPLFTVWCPCKQKQVEVTECASRIVDGMIVCNEDFTYDDDED